MWNTSPKLTRKRHRTRKSPGLSNAQRGGERRNGRRSRLGPTQQTYALFWGPRPRALAAYLPASSPPAVHQSTPPLRCPCVCARVFVYASLLSPPPPRPECRTGSGTRTMTKMRMTHFARGCWSLKPGIFRRCRLLSHTGIARAASSAVTLITCLRGWLM